MLKIIQISYFLFNKKIIIKFIFYLDKVKILKHEY